MNKQRKKYFVVFLSLFMVIMIMLGSMAASAELKTVPDTDTAVAELQERIKALPSAEEYQVMEESLQAEICSEIEDISDIYAGLTEEQQEQVDTEKLTALMETISAEIEVFDTGEQDASGEDASDEDDNSAERDQDLDAQNEDDMSEYAAGIGDTGYGTLQEAINAAVDGETVCLLKDVAENITSTGSSYTLDMQGHTINPNGGRVYYVNGGNVTLKNGTLTGGNSGYGGILIYNAAFHGENLTITGNTSTGGYGAVFIWSSKAELTNCTISNNKSARIGSGIALYGSSSLVGSGITVSGNKFYEGSYAESKWLGGGIYSDATSTIELKNNSVVENNSGYQGGGIYALGPLTITDSTVSGNSAEDIGGGIHARKALSIQDSIISGNTSERSGGGIYAWDVLTITSSKITNNTSEFNGGGIYTYGDGAFNMDGCEVSNNMAYSGGGLYLIGEINIENTNITGNESSNSAAALYLVGVDSRYLSNVTVSNNVCSNTYTGGNSSVAYMQLASQATGDYSLQLENCTFEGNSAVNTIYIGSGGKPAIFSDCTIQDNTSSNATIYFEGYSPDSGLTMEDCYIKNNTAGVAGAIMDVSEGTTTLTNITATGNTATGESDPKTGGIYIDKDSGKGEVTVNACNVEKNVLSDDSINNWYISSVSKVTFDADRQVAKIDDKTYTSIAEAVADVKDRDTIILIAGEEDEYGTAFSSINVTIDKEINIDLNGRTIDLPMGNDLFNVESGGKLTLENAGVINGGISVAGGGSLTLNCQVDKVAVTLEENVSLTVGDGFTCDSLKISLSDDILSRLNAAQTEQSDIVIIEDADEELIEKITVVGLTNPLVKIIKAQNGDLVLHKEVVEGIFIDGVSGNDNSDGSYESPVKSFSKAKELLEVNDTVDTIYVLNKISVSTNETWNLDGKTIVRYPTYKGNMVSITSGNLTLQDVVIDGSREYGVKDAQSMIYVGPSGELTIEDDSILQNNDVSYSSSGKGGAVYINGGTLIINSGKIQNCSAASGGGIYCFRSSPNANKTTLCFGGGEITDNSAYRTNCSGGGISIDGFATMRMTGGTISGNSAPYGGGVSLGGYSFTVANNDENKDNDTEHLIMTGGTIKGNSAGQDGGGIYIQSTYNATILAGNIIDNEGGGGHFGGGGIYVNGGKNYQDGRLQLYNVLIANNTAGKEGGGIAGCNTSDTRQFIINGGVIYQNTADDQKDDILISNSNGVSHLPGVDTESYISEFMLGGGAYMWKRVGTDDHIGVNYLHEAGVKLIYTELKDGDDSIEKAKGAVKVFITGNSASLRGGGIGSNGDVYIGGEMDDTISIPVTKKWVDNDNINNTRPDTVRIWLLRNGERVSCLEFRVNYSYDATKDETIAEWPETLVFSDQPRVDEEGKEYVYTIEEERVADYSSEITGTVDDGFTVTNTYNKQGGGDPIITPTTVSVTKFWNDGGSEDRPNSVSVQLYKNGMAYGSPVTLSVANNWHYEWTGLDNYSIWTVDERSTFDNYVKSISGYGNIWAITNTLKSTDDSGSEDPDDPNKPVDPDKPDDPDDPNTPDNPGKPVNPDKPDKPGSSESSGSVQESDGAIDTGDNSLLIMWAVLLCTTLLALGTVVTVQREIRKK